MPIIAAEQLERITARIFVAADIPPDEASTVGRSLVESNLMGHDSHGVIRIPQYLGMIRDGLAVPGAKVEVVHETPATAVLDGHGGFGQIVARQAMDVAIEKAAGHGSSSVAVRNASHVGRLGEYPAIAAEKGMIGMAMVNNHGGGLCMAALGGTDRRLSPNPISFAIPSGGDRPFLLDMTSSVVAEGKVRVLRNKGEAVPEGWIIDSEGRPTTDPADFYGPPQGSLLPLGGPMAHKGFGLCLVMDIMAGALGGAGCSRGTTAAGKQGLFVQVTNIASFTTLEAFTAHVDGLIEYVKASPKAPGVEEILVPGEPEFREEQRRREEGIPVDDGTWVQLLESAQSVGLDLSDERIG